MVPQFVAHPWHGVRLHVDSPEVVFAFIEITPLDGVKYEIDKESGLMKVDRPQLFSNYVPALYGFIPRTYCSKNVAQLAIKDQSGRILQGDHDPLDILILTEKTIGQGNILVNARPIGGLKMIDKGEVDDKILAVLEGDRLFGNWQDINDMPSPMLDRILHYFLTYKQIPGRESEKQVEIENVYNKYDAYEVIRASITDYESDILLR